MGATDPRIHVPLNDDLWQDVKSALGTVARERPRTEEALNELCADLAKAFCRTRDEFLFRVLCDVSHGYLARVARSLTRDRPYVQSEELVFETFASMFKHLEQFEPRGDNAFFRWLNLIVKNHARMAERTRNRSIRSERRGAQREIDPLGDPLAKSIAREELALMDRRRVQIASEVRECIARMPIGYRDCLRLRLDKKLSYATIAAELEISLGAVTMRIKRAKETILKELAAKGIDVRGFEGHVLELGADGTEGRS